MSLRFVLATLLTAAIACSPAAESTPDAGSTTTPDAGSTTTPDAGGNDTPDAGDDTPDGGGNDTPDAGGDTPDGGGDTPDGGGDTPDGGGDTPAEFPESKYTTFNKSGTRLSAKALTDAVGNSNVAWFEDTTKNVRCQPAVAIDGKTRCLPFPDPMAGVSLNGGYFADATCSTSVMQLRPQCTLDTLKAVVESGGTRVVQLGAQHTGQLYFLSTDRNGQPLCMATAVPAGGFKYFPYTQVAPTDFVEFTASSQAVEGRVGVQVLTGSDGSSTVSGLWDVTSNKPGTLFGGNRLANYHLTRPSYELVPSACGQASNAVVGPVLPDYNPDFVEVILMSSGGPGGPGGPGGGPQRPTLRRVLSAQNFHCRNGIQQNVADNEAVFVLEATETDPLTLPLVDRRMDTRASGLRFNHYVTASGLPIAPVPAAPTIGAAQVPGAQSGVFLRNGNPVVANQAFVSGATFSDAACTRPTGTQGELAENDLYLQLDTEMCQQVPGIEALVKGIWRVNGLAPMTRPVYIWNGAECMHVGDDRYHGMTDLSSSADTYFTAVSLSTL